MKPYIIAEIGINHEGSINRAFKLIDSAKKAGANAVKFQLFEPSTLATKNSKKTSSQKKLMKKETLYEMWRRVSLTANDISKLKIFSHKNKIDFFCSIFDLKSLEIVKKFNIKNIKIASSDITDEILLKEVSKIKKKIFLSTGMSNEKEIRKAIKILKKNKVILLHCVSLYPCPGKFANLNRIISLKKRFRLETGYSDHCIGINSAITAINLGAKVIEKHFTDNKKRTGADHSLSADFKDLKKIVDYANSFEKLKGSGKITPSKKESFMKKFVRKSIYYNGNFPKNYILKNKDLIIKRPFANLQPSYLNFLLNKKLKRKVSKNSPIKKSDIKIK